MPDHWCEPVRPPAVTVAKDSTSLDTRTRAGQRARHMTCVMHDGLFRVAREKRE